jgi:hypothetical protein
MTCIRHVRAVVVIIKTEKTKELAREVEGFLK